MLEMKHNIITLASAQTNNLNLAVEDQEIQITATGLVGLILPLSFYTFCPEIYLTFAEYSSTSFRDL